MKKIIFCIGILGVLALSSTNLSAAIKNGENPQMQMDSSGNVLSVWEAVDNSTGLHVIQSAHYNAASGTWSSPIILSSTGSNAYSPIIASNDTGNTVAMWVYTDTNTAVTRLSSVSCSTIIGGTWSTPTNVSNSTENVSNDYKVTINSAGQVLAIWSSYVTINTRIRSATLQFGGSWSNPQTISDP